MSDYDWAYDAESRRCTVHYIERVPSRGNLRGTLCSMVSYGPKVAIILESEVDPHGSEPGPRCGRCVERVAHLVAKAEPEQSVAALESEVEPVITTEEPAAALPAIDEPKPTWPEPVGEAPGAADDSDLAKFKVDPGYVTASANAPAMQNEDMPSTTGYADSSLWNRPQTLAIDPEPKDEHHFPWRTILVVLVVVAVTILTVVALQHAQPPPPHPHPTHH